MTASLILAALVFVPALVVLIFRANGAIAFMSLCVGSVLVTYVSGDVGTIATSLSASQGMLKTDQWVQLGLLIAPFLLTMLFVRGSVRGTKKITNFLPALAAGLLFALFVVPLLPANTQRQVHQLSLWHQLSNLQVAVLLGGTVLSLLFLLLTHHKQGAGEVKKHGKD